MNAIAIDHGVEGVLHARSLVRANLLISPPFIGCSVAAMITISGLLSLNGPNHVFFYPGMWIPVAFFGGIGVLLPLFVLPFTSRYMISRLDGTITRYSIGHGKPGQVIAYVSEIADCKVWYDLSGWRMRIELKGGKILQLHLSHLPWAVKADKVTMWVMNT